MVQYVGSSWYNNPNILLCLMVISYMIPISYVYYKHTTTCKSISSIITSKEPFFVDINSETRSLNADHTILAVNGGGGLYELLNHITSRTVIAMSMGVMGIFTILYEIHRDEIWSLFTIILLLIGIFGVISIPEIDNTHYIFAGIAFLSILLFMIYHSFYSKKICSDVKILLYSQILFAIITIIGVIHDKPIFIFEALFLLNFAVYYVILHNRCSII